MSGGVLVINTDRRHAPLLQAYGQTFIHDDHFLSLVASVSAIFNAVGRPFWGLLADRTGYRVGRTRVGTGWVGHGWEGHGWIQDGYRYLSC